MSRVCIIGDVHGCIEELTELFSHIPANTEVVFAGDLVDKGPESADVIRFARLSGARSVMGNHDFKHYRYHRKVAEAIGGLLPEATEEITSVANNLSMEDKTWLSELPYYIKLPEHNTLVVHGGVTPHHKFFPTMEEIRRYTSKKRSKYEHLFYVRYIGEDGFMVGNVFSPKEGLTHWTKAYDGRFGHIYYGHDPHFSTSPARSKHASGIDLACCSGGHLCGVILEDGKEVDIITIPAKQVYCDKILYPE